MGNRFNLFKVQIVSQAGIRDRRLYFPLTTGSQPGKLFGVDVTHWALKSTAGPILDHAALEGF